MTIETETEEYTPTKRASRAAGIAIKALTKLGSTGRWVLDIANGLVTSIKGDPLEGAELEQYVTEVNDAMEWNESNKSERSNLRRIAAVYDRLPACYEAYCKKIGKPHLSRIVCNKLITKMKAEPSNKKAIAAMALSTEKPEPLTGLKACDALLVKVEKEISKIDSKSARFVALKADLASAIITYRG